MGHKDRQTEPSQKHMAGLFFFFVDCCVPSNVTTGETVGPLCNRTHNLPFVCFLASFALRQQTSDSTGCFWTRTKNTLRILMIASMHMLIGGNMSRSV